MNKETIISTILILFGFASEYVYLNSDNPTLNIKIAIVGMAALIIGVIGLWLYAILPAMETKDDKG